MRASRVLRAYSGLLRLEGEELPYRVEWRRVRYPRLEFKSGNLLVILPPNCKNERPLLEEKKAWILEKHRLMKESLEGADELLLLGEPFQLRPSGDGGVSLDFGKREVTCDPGNVKHVQRLREILREELRKRILEKVGELGKITGLLPSRIYIRLQRSKWASCSSSGNLSFNLRMIALPPRLIGYVVLHELLHLKYPRHDREFWGRVEEFSPDYREMEKELLRYWFSTVKGGGWLFDRALPGRPNPPEHPPAPGRGSERLRRPAAQKAPAPSSTPP
jgi:predicted metal-dependent hydrolase